MASARKSYANGEFIHAGGRIGHGHFNHAAFKPNRKNPQIAIGRAEATPGGEFEAGTVERAHHRTPADTPPRKQRRLMCATIIHSVKTVIGPGKQNMPAPTFTASLPSSGKLLSSITLCQASLIRPSPFQPRLRLFQPFVYNIHFSFWPASKKASHSARSLSPRGPPQRNKRHPRKRKRTEPCSSARPPHVSFERVRNAWSTAPGPCAGDCRTPVDRREYPHQCRC